MTEEIAPLQHKLKPSRGGEGARPQTPLEVQLYGPRYCRFEASPPTKNLGIYGNVTVGLQSAFS